MKNSELIQLRNEWKKCERCSLYEFTFKHVVIEVCNYKGEKVKLADVSSVDILFIGEAPGITEDATGRPFVGRSGKLLRDTINEEIEKRSWKNITYGITNTVACRPENNRQPSFTEISTCSPRVESLIKILKPNIVCSLGKVAQQAFENRYAFTTRNNTAFIFAYHPAYVLRRGNYGRFKDQISQVFDLV